MAGIRGPDDPKAKNIEPTMPRAKAAEGGRFQQMQPAEEPRANDGLLGKTIGSRYKILEPIGEGGMGKVYLAEDMRLGKKVAVKVLPEYFEKMPNIAERFVQEALLAPAIEHENIIDVTDRGKTSRGVPFFVMEYLKGSDLAGVIGSEGPMPWCERTKTILMQMCRGLGAAHEKGIIHRDMKPENVFLLDRSDGSTFIKLFDFGIAKLMDSAIEEGKAGEGASAVPMARTGMTQAGAVMGTPQYMAPEQASGGDIDSRVDVYAVGTIMYEMLCGRVPFVLEAKESPMADAFKVLDMQKNLAPVPPRVLRPDLAIPPEVEAVVLKALSKDREERFQSMKEMEEALDAIKAPKTIPLSHRSEASVGGLRPGSRSMIGYTVIAKEEARRSTRALRIAALAVAAALAAAGAGITVHRMHAGHEAPADAGVEKNVDSEIPQHGKK